MTTEPPTTAAINAHATPVYIGMGANLGKPVEAIAQAIEALKPLAMDGVVCCSPLYRSAPMDADGPDYINAVAMLMTTHSAHAMLAALQQIEQSAGRERSYRNAPRTLDLDLLLYGQVCIDDPLLTVPHPRMTQRAFVLKPLVDLNPQVQIPGLGLASKLLAFVQDQRIELI